MPRLSFQQPRRRPISQIVTCGSNGVMSCEEEWVMHLELLAAARAALKSFHDNPQKASVAEVTRMVDLASRIGRLSTEPDRDENPDDDSTAVMIEFHAALRKVYARRTAEGRPIPADTVIDVTPADGGAA